MTKVYLTASSADAAVTAGSGTKWKAGWAPGGSSTHLNKNSVAGPTAPLQMTDGATAGTDGTVVSWYTEPLYAVTIAGAISCLFWDRENATANNVAPTIRIERCSGDGTPISTIVAETTSHGAGEMPTTAGGASDALNISAANVTDTSLSDGDRLRITLWIDDASGQGGTGSMASGGRGEFWVNGPNGAAGQSELSFTELVIPQAGPRLVTTPETSFTTTTTPKDLVASGALTDDLLVALFGGDNFSTATTAAATSTNAGTTSAWTEVLEALVGTTDSPWKSNAWANVTADGDVTVRLARTQSSAQVWGGWLAHLRENGGIGNTAELVDSSADSVSLTVSEGSMVLAFGIEWDHLAVTAFTPAGAHDIERNAGLTAVSWYAGFWVGQAAGTRNYGIATNGSTSFSLTVIEILAPAGGTAVGKELALSWDVRAALGDSLQAIWDVRSAVSDDLVGIWDVRSLVTDSIALSWDTRASVGDELSLVWDADGPVQKDLGLLWDVRAAVADTVALSWDIRAALGDEVALVWDVRASVGDNLVALWDARSVVGDLIALSWDVRGAAGDTLALVWDVRSPTGQTISLIWDVEADTLFVSKDLSLLWNADGPVGKALGVNWDVRSVLGDDLAVAWDIRAALSDSLALLWDARSVVGDPLSLQWDVRAASGDSLALSWHISALAGDDLVLIWDTESDAVAILYLLRAGVLERWRTGVDDRGGPIQKRWRTEVLDRWRTVVKE